MGIGFRAIPHFHRAKTPTTTSYSGVQGTVVCRKRDNTSKVQKNNEEHNGKQFGLVFGQRQIWKAGTSFVFSIRDFIYKLQMKKTNNWEIFHKVHRHFWRVSGVSRTSFFAWDCVLQLKRWCLPPKGSRRNPATVCISHIYIYTIPHSKIVISKKIET